MKHCTVKMLHCIFKDCKRTLKCESSLNKRVKKHDGKEYSCEQCGKFSTDDI